jgi:hypothetical protein
MIDSIDQTPRTGDVKASYWSSAPLGWVSMNDGTIGNVGSGASLAAAQYTFQLYKTLWDAISNTYAPVSGGRGASAIADFLANKTMQLPLSLGRVLAGAGSGSGLTATVLGQYSGSESSTLTLTGPNLPDGAPYNPNAGTGNFNATFTGPGNVPGNNAGGAWSFGVTTPITISRLQPASYMNVFIKL